MDNAEKLPINLSKSRVMRGLQCEKSLFLQAHSPELATPVSASQQLIFDQGHAVGIEAQRRFPSGVLIEAPHTEPDKAIEDTARAISDGALILYEAAFRHDDVLVRVDILHRENQSAPWRIVEVKSSTSLKPQYIPDSAVQTWVLRSAGLEVVSTSVWHINSKCKFPNLSNLFTAVDVTKEVDRAIPSVVAAIKNFKAFLVKATAPIADIGPHCDDPYECSFKAHCWESKNIPEVSIFDIPGLQSRRKWGLYSAGNVDLSKLQGEKLNASQKRMVEVTNSGKRFVDQNLISGQLRAWTYPLYFLDFETMAWAIPRYAKTKPYQQIPFQFSCHVQMKRGGPILHGEYLHEVDTDPRPELAEHLIESLGKTGAVVSYNKAFEARCLRELAEALPDYSEALLSIETRLVDPLAVFRKAVYDPKFRGSFSIKSVAPALIGDTLSYEGMEVSDGCAAQAAYLELISPTCSEEQKGRLKAGMLAYCRQDTMAMVSLVEWLWNEVDLARGE